MDSASSGTHGGPYRRGCNDVPVLFDDKAEREIIGHIAASETAPERLSKVLETVMPEWFFLRETAALFRAAQSLATEGKTIDPTEWATRAKAKDARAFAGLGPDLWISQCLAGFAPTERIDGAARRMRDKWMARKVLSGDVDVDSLIRTEADRIAKAANGSVPPYTLRNPCEIEAAPPDPNDNWMGDHLITKGSRGITMLGEGGLGKSRLAFQLAFCAVLGKPFLGIVTHMRLKRWLFLQTENGTARLHADMSKMLTAFCGTRADREDIRECIAISTLELDSDGFMSFDNPSDLARIGAAISEHGPDIVVIDPLYDKAQGDLNSDADMRTVLNRICQTVKRGNAARVPLVLHHALPGKAGAMKAVGYDAGSFARNSKVIHQWARGQFNIVRNPACDDAQEVDRLIVACGKVSDGKRFPTFGITLNPTTGIYEPDTNFSLEASMARLRSSRRGSVTPKNQCEDVLALLDGSITRPRLVEMIMEKFNCKSTKANNLIDDCVNRGLIRIEDVGPRGIQILVKVTS